MTDHYSLARIRAANFLRVGAYCTEQAELVLADAKQTTAWTAGTLAEQLRELAGRVDAVQTLADRDKS